MAGDLGRQVEQVFDERDLYESDLVAEDALDDSSSCQASVPLRGRPREEGDDAGSAPPADQADGDETPSGRPPRRKRTTERATKIVYWLETKYDCLEEVCASYENWKELPNPTWDFDLLWCDTAIPADRFTKLKLYQKMNHFVGMSSITRKNNLGRNLLRMRKQFPKEYKFFPETWILPTDLADFKAQFTASKTKQTFIVKPDNGCQGKGIFLVRDVEKVPVDFTATYVAQRYINSPYLLDGFKFDLRLYVLVTGCDPLRILLHKHGLVRLASEPYVEPTAKNISQAHVHLTNYAINKDNPNFEENTNPEDASDGHKRSWEAVRDFLRKEGHDVDALMAGIEDLIVKTLLAVQPSLSHVYHSCQPDDMENGMCFEILGFDVMLDRKLQPWLLEVNHAPSFATESELDRLVKEEVLRDTFTLLNFSPEARRQKKQDAREKMEQRATNKLGKRTSMEENFAMAEEIARTRTEWEDANLGGYKRLYPTSDSERAYLPIHNAAIGIWETMMGGSSRRPIRITSVGDDEGQKGEARGSEESEAAKPKRTAEELNEIIERLASNRPRDRASVRHRAALRAAKGSEEAASDSEADHMAAAAAAAAEQQPQELTAKEVSGVKVGDVIKVQTNMGWEAVTVRAKRTNGKLDIQFKDGEYMRSVLPRIKPPQDSAAPALGSGLAQAPLPPAPPLAPTPADSASAAASPVARPAPARAPGYSPVAQQRLSVASTPPRLPGGRRPSRSPTGSVGSLAESPSVLAAEGALLGQTPEEALACLDQQLSAQIHARLPSRTQIVVPDMTRGPLGITSYAPAIPSPPTAGNRPHELRLRQHLQQLINVRPIVRERALGVAEALSPRRKERSKARRHTYSGR